jgi:hypothetical protein
LIIARNHLHLKHEVPLVSERKEKIAHMCYLVNIFVIAQ